MKINRMPRRWILTLALCIGLTALTAGPAQAAPARVRIIDLGTLGGGGSDGDRHQRPGAGRRAQLDRAGEGRSFIWHRGKMTDLGTLGGGNVSATAMNKRGEIVGTESERPNGFPSHAFLWRAGVIRDLGTLGGDSAQASDINDRGQVVGESLTSDGSTHPFLWDKGVMTDLDPLGGEFSSALVINDRSQVAVTRETTIGAPQRRFCGNAGN